MSADLEGVPKVPPRRAARGALVEDGGQGEDIHLLVAVRPGKLLRRHVLGGAMHVCGRQEGLCRVLFRAALASEPLEQPWRMTVIDIDTEWPTVISIFLAL